MSGTGDPRAAREHARAMAGTRAESMPILPASSAAPDGVAPADMIWAETIAPGGYASKQLARGARLRLEDVRGDAHLSMLIFNAERPVERLNIADTLKVQWNAYLGPGKLLLSDMGRVLLSIIEDEAGAYDAFCGPSTAMSNKRAYGGGEAFGPNPSARDRFLVALGKYGLGRKDVHPCLNLFKPVTIGANGETRLEIGPFGPGRSVTMRCEMDVIVVLANCPHVLDPRPVYSVTPARVLALRGDPASAEDAIRLATPEAERAFLNVDDYYLR